MTEPDRPERSDLRASDVDRELTAQQLRRHASAGRLTLAELDQRLEWAYSATTIGDLRKLTADLPDLAEERAGSAAASLEKREPPRAPARRSRRGSAAGGLEWWGYLSTNVILILVWALSGAGYPWFLWFTGFAGIGVIGNEIRRRTQGPEGGTEAR